MNRKSFFKGLLGLIIAPKLISKIRWNRKPNATQALFRDLNQMRPSWDRKYHEKYGLNDFTTKEDYLSDLKPFDTINNKPKA